MASNQPKSAKRPLGEDQGAASSRFPVRKLSVVQQFDGKRRKTEEEADYGAKPTMAPPIRQSAVRKVCEVINDELQLLLISRRKGHC